MEEKEQENQIDVITVDVPLFIRLLEFAREDSTDDAQLHEVATKLVELCQDGDIMTMEQYDEIVDSKDQVATSGMNAVEDDMNTIDEQRWMKLAGILTEEEDEDEADFDLSEAFANSPESAPYNDVLGIIESYEEPQIIEDFKTKFAGQDTISKQDYSEFANQFIDDMSEEAFIQANWISMFDDDIYEKAGLV